MLAFISRTLNALALLLVLPFTMPSSAIAAWALDGAQVIADPVVTVAPERGGCRSRFVARGEGFPPSEEITLVLRIARTIPHNLPTISGPVSADGTFAIAIPPPLIACLPDQPQPGERQYEVFAVIGFGAGQPGTDLATATFTVAPPPRQCFPETGQCIDGMFLEYWLANGGLALNGYPLSEVLSEQLEDGRPHTVQYFERARLEYHPDNPPPYDVLLGQFGRRFHPADPPAQPQPGATYFPETGHNVGGRFLAYWQQNGGLAQFGYPLGETFTEQLEDGNEYTVQYFERARFEHHPEHPPPYDVLLGQFGRRILAESGR